MTTTELPGGHRRVLRVQTEAKLGQVRLEMDGLVVRGVAMPTGRVIYPHDVRHLTGELVDAHTVLWSIMRDLLKDGVALFVDVPETDGNTEIVLGVSPAGEHNAFNMLFALGYLVNYLRTRASHNPIRPPEESHADMTEQASMGWNETNTALLEALEHDLFIAFNLAISADAP